MEQLSYILLFRWFVGLNTDERAPSVFTKNRDRLLESNIEAKFFAAVLNQPQPGRVIAHVVNLTATGRMPVTDDDLVPSEPLKLGIRLPVGVGGRSARMLVSGKGATPALSNGWARLVIPSVLDHEVLVIE